MEWLLVIAALALAISVLVRKARREWQHTPLAWEGRMGRELGQHRLFLSVWLPATFPDTSEVTVAMDWWATGHRFRPDDPSTYISPDYHGRYGFWDEHDRVQVTFDVRIPTLATQVWLHVGDNILQVLDEGDLARLSSEAPAYDSRACGRRRFSTGRHALKLAIENGDGTVSTQDIGTLEVKA
jgi:hypothetical protein